MVKKLSDIGSRLVRLIEWLAKGFWWLGAVCSMIMVITIVLDALTRYLFNTSLGWPFEITEFLMLPVVFLPVGYVLVQERHLAMEILFDHFSSRTQAVLKVFIQVVSIVWFSVLFIVGWEATWDALVMRLTSASVHRFPLFPVRLVIPVGTFVMLLVLVTKLFQNIKALKHTR
jgi:TRAP-type C4-dicarboxylate transport system permease small subunit